MARIEIWARPGSRVDRIIWDPWRGLWAIQCREPARDGRANAAILRLIADRLAVPLGSVRYRSAGRSRAKSVEVEGLSDDEVRDRLFRAQGSAGREP